MMATLIGMINIFGGYSTAIDKINRKIDESTNKILKASGSADNLSKKLVETGASAKAASNGLGKMIKSVAGFAEKGMSIIDKFTNTNIRLSVIDKNPETPEILQNKVFAAANRSRVDYSDMANSVSDLGIMGGDTFNTNDETIAFAELMQKSYKLGGGSESDQSAGMSQLTKSMGAGKLEGDEFSSIAASAPMIAEAISMYTGKSIGELKQMSADGEITADIIKNAMFAMGDQINDKFIKMPMTFADVWTSIKNGGTQAFSKVMEKVSELIKSDGFTQFINGLLGGLTLVANVAGLLITVIASIASFFVDNWSIISPILMGIVASIIAYNAVMGIAWLTTLKDLAVKAAHAIASGVETAAIIALTLAQNGFNAALALCPITWIIILVIALIAAIYAVIAAINHFAGTSISATGVIMGAFSAVGALLWNLLLGILELVFGVINRLVNPFIDFANFIGNIFTNPISSIIYGFQGMADNILGIIEMIASALDHVFGTKMGDAVAGWRLGLKDMADTAVKKYAPEENYSVIFEKLDLGVDDLGLNRIDYGDAYEAGYSFGEGIDTKVKSFADLMTGTGAKLDDEPLEVQGAGQSGAVEVEMVDDNLQYLRGVADRDYVAKIANNTLAPNIVVQFGDVHQTADADQVAGRIKTILQEEIATTSEGVYE